MINLKKVLVVDDSALIRRELGRLLEEAGFDIEFAKDGYESLQKVAVNDYDVITMDINMPEMDGLTALKEIMKHKPTPIVMVSSLTQGDADITFDCLDAGAVDFVGKPGTITLKVKDTGQDIITKVTAASKLTKNKLLLRKAGNIVKIASRTQVVQKVSLQNKKIDKIVLVGASTGGPGLIEQIVANVPADYPYPICVVQHMPENFTKKFANRLNKVSNLEVVEATNNEIVSPGKIIIGKGGSHMHFSKKASGIISIKLAANTGQSFFTPSVDEMFFSAAKNLNVKKILAIELTGIGSDGADGMVELKNKGAYTIAESKETAIIYGMPKEAFERGGTVEVLPFPKILEKIIRFK
jgi:two-component system chemotaxis response regulator CheB